MHDVGWPLARRDAYEAPDQIPEEHRQPLARGVGLAPGQSGSGSRWALLRVRRGAGGRSAETASLPRSRTSWRSARPAPRRDPRVLRPGRALAPRTRPGPPRSSAGRALGPQPDPQRPEENRILHLIARLDLDHELDRERTARRQPDDSQRCGDISAAAPEKPLQPAQRGGEPPARAARSPRRACPRSRSGPARSRWRASSPRRPPPPPAAPAASSRPRASPTPATRPSHFSATFMWASIQPPMSPIRSSE